jgi:hypothetical protein
MAIKRIYAKDFKLRSDLENEVRNKFGLTTDIKDAEIVGTEDELARLSLSHTNIFWGIKCVVTNTDIKSKPVNDVDRGEQTDFGINQRNNKTQ